MKPSYYLTMTSSTAKKSYIEKNLKVTIIKFHTTHKKILTRKGPRMGWKEVARRRPTVEWGLSSGPEGPAGQSSA